MASFSTLKSSWFKSSIFQTVGILFVLSGTSFYSFGILLKPLMNEFGWSRGMTSLAHTIFMLTTALRVLMSFFAVWMTSSRVRSISLYKGGKAWFIPLNLSGVKKGFEFVNSHPEVKNKPPQDFPNR